MANFKPSILSTGALKALKTFKLRQMLNQYNYDLTAPLKRYFFVKSGQAVI